MKDINIIEYKVKSGYLESLNKIFLQYPEMFYKEDLPIIKKRVGEDSKKEYPKLVALFEDKPVGFISAAKPSDSPNIWFLSWFAVDKNYQDMGIGTKLIKEIEKVIEQSTTPHMYIYTSGSNHKVNKKTSAFYLKMGYKVVGRIPKFYSEDEDKVIFYKSFF